jgi:uncharacterized protein (TIGR02145 family)
MQPQNANLLVITLFCIGLTGLMAQNVKDIDGNIYPIINIGKQVWMKENLKTTRYSNGDLIGTTIPSTLDISVENAPKYQWAYNGNDSNVAIYGRLYTWYAVTDRRYICPAGWHVPTDTEWSILTDYLTNKGFGYGGNGTSIAKSMAATLSWFTDGTAGNVGNDQSSNNNSGFTAIAGGYRYGSGLFDGIGSYGYWWSATGVDITTAWYRNLCDNRNCVFRDNSNKHNGVSIRCLKNN